MRPLRVFALFVGLSALVLGSGCKGNCRQLAEKLCDCSLTPLDQQNCLAQVGIDDTNYAPNDEDDQRCGPYLKTCNCHLIDTPEGKKACGLAR